MRALPNQSIKRRFERIKHTLTETSIRLWAASEALELGYGGIRATSMATGLSATTIRAGLKELKELADAKLVRNTTAPAPATLRQRKAGGGRKRLDVKNPQLIEALEKLVEPYTSGDPMRPLRWTCKSTRELARALTKAGYRISADTVGRLLIKRGYSLQSNRKRFEGKQHPDRNAQFEYIAEKVEAFAARGCPVISVDTKKKELVGNFKNAGREWTATGVPLEVSAYDFIDADKGKAIPYGIYDTRANLGWVNVGTDSDTAEFAVTSISRWWSEMGEWMYPEAKEILIMADGGGSNGSRNRLWKKCLQEWADREELTVMVCHFPPGTSKWNKIEHRMFCHISKNWRGKPLISHEVIIELIGATKTSKGLKITAQLDTNFYAKGVKVTDTEMADLAIQNADFHGEWNYFFKPRVS